VSLHVERRGAGPDLVLLHGWGLHSGVWAEVLPALSARFRVHAIDLPGHGASAGVTVAGLDAAAERVAAVMPEGALLCGWSLGGLVAQRVASRHAAKVRALALVSSTACFVARDGWPHGMKSSTLDAFGEGLRRDPHATLESFVRLNALHGARGRDAVRAFASRLTERGPPSVSGLEHGLRWLRDADLRGEVASIGQPTVVLHGARDALTPVAAGRWLAANLPDARWVELADAAHLPFFTHPQSFVSSLESLVG
jgi:pimeloyl-[acyl-carrier protein] methyl ester esterase